MHERGPWGLNIKGRIAATEFVELQGVFAVEETERQKVASDLQDIRRVGQQAITLLACCQANDTRL
jgi:hypothetical protein